MTSNKRLAASLVAAAIAAAGATATATASEPVAPEPAVTETAQAPSYDTDGTGTTAPSDETTPASPENEGAFDLGIVDEAFLNEEAAQAPYHVLPFPCRETWQAGTRSDHNPRNSVDFNHYPDDNGWKVYASKAGRVSTVRDLGNKSYGQYIVIDHGNGESTLYAHLQRRDVRVKVGDRVSNKTWIARVGSTGRSSGPHLHYEQKRGGSVVQAKFKDGNPAYYGKRNLVRKTDCF